MLGTFIRAFARKLYNYLYFQIVISFFSLPILLLWGIEVSLFCFAGNMLFAPFLFLFLFFSSLIFFTQLVYIPNTFFIWCLEKVTHCWLFFLECIPATSPMVCPKPPIIVLIVMIMTLFVLLHIKKKLDTKLLCIHFFLFFLFIFALKNRPIKSIETITFANHPLYIAYTNKQVIMIDQGYLGRRAYRQSAIMYELRPKIIKKIGSTTIDHLIVCKPTNSLFATLCTLIEQFEVKAIYMPFFTGTLSKNGKYNYAQFCKLIKEKNVIVNRIGSKPIKKKEFTINPLQTLIKSGNFSCAALEVLLQIDNNQITFYSATYKPSTHTLCQKETI